MRIQNVTAELTAQRSLTPISIHWMRHGKVASHRGDIPVTAEGMAEVEVVGRRLAATLQDGELVSILYASTLRSRQTAQGLQQSMLAALDGVRPVELVPPVEEWAIRNPDVYIAGRRVEMVSTGQAMAEQTAAVGLGAAEVEQLPFYRDFFPSPDRVGYWVGHPNPPGENADAVARRLMTFGISLLDRPGERPRRYICVTHSPVLRAFLQRYLLGHDPGEPGWLESVDLILRGDGSATIRFRDRERTIRL